MKQRVQRQQQLKPRFRRLRLLYRPTIQHRRLQARLLLLLLPTAKLFKRLLPLLLLVLRLLRLPLLLRLLRDGGGKRQSGLFCLNCVNTLKDPEAPRGAVSVL